MISLIVLFELAEMKRISKRHRQAESIYHIVLPVFEKEYGIEYPQTLEVKHSIGWNLVQMGSVKDGESLLRSVLAAKTRVLGPHHPNTAKLVGQLKYYLKEDNRYIELFMMWKRFRK